MRKVLFYQWNAFMQRGIKNALDKLDIDYDIYYDITDNWDENKAFALRFCNKLKSKNYTEVFSVNFMPIISDVCEELGVNYISWVYDSPLHIRKIKSLKNMVNTIYFFDRKQSEDYRKCGVTGARYMPLAASPAVFGCEHILQKHTMYNSDISFLGQLYKSEIYDLVSALSQYNRGYLEAVIDSQMAVSQGFIIDSMLDGQIMKNINADFLKASNGTYSVTDKELSYTLAKEVTGRQRVMALALLQNRFDVNVFSLDKSEQLNNVKYHGYADYYEKMPEVFSNSRINLNISLCTIESGIPLRVLDIMACKGFVISNPQPEIFEYFTPGHDIEIYENMTDLMLKIKYYLEHEDERKHIAYNGYNKIQAMFNFEDRIKAMFKI